MHVVLVGLLDRLVLVRFGKRILELQSDPVFPVDR